MKAASGELSLTVITIIAIGLVIGFFTTVFWNSIKNTISNQWSGVSTKNEVIKNYGEKN